MIDSSLVIRWRTRIRTHSVFPMRSYYAFNMHIDAADFRKSVTPWDRVETHLEFECRLSQPVIISTGNKELRLPTIVVKLQPQRVTLIHRIIATIAEEIHLRAGKG